MPHDGSVFTFMRKAEVSRFRDVSLSLHLLFRCCFALAVMDSPALPEPVRSVSTLFHPFVAFFSPLVSASVRSSWTSHGGRLATHDAVRGDECDIDFYFALPGQPDELVDRSAPSHP